MVNEKSNGVRRHCGLLFFILFVFMLNAGCTPRLPKSPEKGGKTFKADVDIRLNGLRRTYVVHLPPGYDTDRPLPMIVMLHGAFGTGKGMARNDGFNRLADEKQFIAIYPNGVGALGLFQHWNAGHCCSKAAEAGIDDVGFIATVIEDACARLAVDRQRIFMVGYSNGGMMAHRFAAERGDMLAAFAVLAGSAGGRPDSRSAEWSIPVPVKPLPVLAIHGMEDVYVPFEGGTSSARESEQAYWSVLRSLNIWVARDGCQEPPVRHDERQGRVHVRTWAPCRTGGEVVLYALEGWGHTWPGPHFTADLDPRDPLYNFDVARIIWAFFEKVR